MNESGANGYSDPINHALAFAAKHHDRQVHKGARAPYRTHAANVGIILTRYAQDDATVVAGVLYDYVEDSLRERDALDQLGRASAKFGERSIEIARSIVPQATDGAGIELSHAEAREQLLAAIGDSSEASRWVCAARAIHDVASILADLRRTIDAGSVWSTIPMGRAGTAHWYRMLHDRLQGVGFNAPIMAELRAAVDELDHRATSDR